MAASRAIALTSSTRCLVLGCTGMVGRRVVDQLLERRCRVHGAARFGDSQARERLRRRGVQAHPFDVTRDNPTGLSDVDVVFL